MSKPVLVLVMSHKCGACQNFKRKALPDLERELRKNQTFEFVILNFPEMMIPARLPNMEFHPQLRNGVVEFYPTFLLFPGDLWWDDSSELRGVAKHNLKTNPNIDYSKKSILNWIEDTLKTNEIFTQGHRQPTKKSEFVIPTYGTYTKFHPTKINSNI